MKPRILVLEDDHNLGFILQEHLELNDFQVTWCKDGTEGLAAFRKQEFSLCLVDVMMPKMDGFEFVRTVRKENQQIPIIFLTAKNLKEDRIEGFKIGCDDYVNKPFSIEELLLRMQAVLRRSGHQAAGANIPVVFRLNDYTFYYQQQMLLTPNHQQISLTTRESDLLRLFCLHCNQLLEREVALKTIWGNDSYFTARSMDVFISRLRKYFTQDPRISILSIHGKGYKMLTDCSEQPMAINPKDGLS